jgi:hypothetical protein
MAQSAIVKTHAKPEVRVNVVTTRKLQSHVTLADMHVRSVHSHQHHHKDKRPTPVAQNP